MPIFAGYDAMTTSYSNIPPSLDQVRPFGRGSTFDKAAYAAYEALKSERDALKEAEGVSKRRIEALEKETKDLLASYQGIYEENRVLRSKVEHGPDAQRIRNFRSEIKRLEDKVTSLRTENELLTKELASVQKQSDQTSEDKRRIDDAFKSERALYADKIKALEKDNKSSEEKIERLERQLEEYERRVKNYDEESDGLISRYKELKRDNLKMETKFKQQKYLIDEEIRETRETNKEMAKEIIGLKTKLAKLQSDYHSVKLDFDAAQKQIDYQNKELEVYKTQSSLMKKNVKITTHEYNSMKDELKSVEDMLIDAQNFGFETVIEDRRHVRRKERKQLQRIEGLVLQLEELSRENNNLERELNESRKKMEAAIMEKENILFAETALKRRVEILETANIDLDRQTKFMFDSKKKGLIVTMPDENLKNLEKEKAALFAKCRFLETQNRRFSRRIRELENGDEIDVLNENLPPYGLKLQRTQDHVIHADMPVLSDRDPNKSYRRKMRNVHSLPN